MSDSLRFEDLEAEFGALRDAFGRLVVARHRGEDVVALARAYARRRMSFATRFASADDGPSAGVEQAGLASIRSTLAWMDEFEPVDESGAGASGATGATGAIAPGEAASADLRRQTVEAYGAAAAAIRVGDQVIDRLTALGRLATEPDPARRRAIFEALAPVWRAVDGDGADGPSPYRELLRSSAATWARDGSPVEAAATALGMAPGSLEPALRAILAEWRAVLEPGPLEPWDYRYVVGAMERRLGSLVPRERMRAINDAHLASLGADPAALGIRYDVEPRPGRPLIPVAFTISEDVARRAAGSWRAATPWVFATYAEGGLGNLEELVHESGHALHYAAIRARPAFFEPPVEAGGLVEGIADMLGWDVHEPAFQARHLGASCDRRDSRLGRYGGVMLDVCWALFEIELHRNPGRRPNDAWAEITGAGLGIVPHPDWSWWAVRGQLVEAPGYMANYALAAIVAAALRARIRAVRGEWQGGDPGWFAFVSEHLLRFGADRSPAEVLESFLGRTLDVDPLISDLTTS